MRARTPFIMLWMSKEAGFKCTHSRTEPVSAMRRSVSMLPLRTSMRIARSISSSGTP